MHRGRGGVGGVLQVNMKGNKNEDRPGLSQHPSTLADILLTGWGRGWGGVGWSVASQCERKQKRGQTRLESTPIARPVHR